jgi:hypothetical protein
LKVAGWGRTKGGLELTSRIDAVGTRDTQVALAFVLLIGGV